MKTRLIVLVGIVGLFTVVPSCASPCGVKLVNRVPSPDGQWDVVIYERSCGATTDFGTHLSVLRTGAKVPNKPGNLFIADSDHGAAPLVEGNIINLSIQWARSDSIVVRYDRRARVFAQVSRVQNITVAYVPVAGGA